MKPFVVSIVCALCLQLWTGIGTYGGELPTQSRAKNESFEEALQRYRLTARVSSSSALDVAVSLEKIDLSKVIHWGSQGNSQGSAEELSRGFERLRDDRFLALPERSEFSRRASWLFPDDGCFARAAVTGQQLARIGFDRPSKLFIFGELRVQTPNGPAGEGGFVYWWYHLVNAVSEAGRIYVLDPAINPAGAMLLEDWVRTMVTDLKDVRVAICEPYAYEPGSSCFSSGPEEEASALENQMEFLRAESSRLLELGRSPEKELGASPPWAP